jgi:membrane protease YdiL (CAAX protease family)
VLRDAVLAMILSQKEAIGMSVSSFGKQHPFRLVGLLEVSVVAVFVGVFLILKRIISALDSSDIDLVLNGIAYSILAVVTAVLLERLHWWQAAGFQRPARGSFLLLFWLPMLPLVLNLVGGLKIAPIEPWRIGVFLVVSLLVGFVEEGIFRGLMVRALYSKGIWTAAVASSVLFGLAHSLNFALGENAQAVAL